MPSGAILESLDEKDIVDLIAEKKLLGNELISNDLDTNWENIANNSIFQAYFHDRYLKTEETFIANIKNLGNNKEVENNINIQDKVEKPSFNEFPFEHKDPSLKDRLKIASDNKKSEEKSEIFELSTTEVNDEKVNNKLTSEPSRELESTKVNIEYKKYLDELQAVKEREKIQKVESEQDIEIEEVITDYENDSTEVISINDLKSDLQDAVEAESEFDTENKDRAKKKNKKVKKVSDLEDPVSDNDGKRKKLIGLVIGVLLILLVLMDDDDQSKKSKKIILTDPEIQFPSRYDVEDQERAKAFFNKGLQELRKSTYKSNILAAKYFSKSVENKFTGNPAMAKLIFVYSLMLINSTERNLDANSIFKLVQIFDNRAFTDPNFASAISLFYYSIGKTSAALHIFDRYNTLNKRKATLELFAVRLLALTKAGSLDRAEKIAKRLGVESNKDLLTIESLFEFYKIQDQQSKMENLLREGLSVYPNSAYLLIEKGLLSIENGNLKDVSKILEKLSFIKMEESRYHYSRYLILSGMYYANKKNVKVAADKFEKSLKLFESINLIEKLALLNGATDSDVDSLIVTSKAKKYLVRAKLDFKKGELNSAFKYGLKASNTAPDLIEVRLFLAQLQLKRGYINDAIVQLESLYKENSSSLDILFGLIDAYTEAYKFKKVVTLLGAARGLSNQDEDRFSSAQAKYSIYRGDYFSGSGWLQRAINANPLNNDNIYELAKLYLRFHQYDKGKKVLKRAMVLDPTNVDYRISFAQILYEIENSAAAIGYLYDVLSDFPDNPNIYSSIGIYYYRSGQIKKYEETKKKLLSLPNKDISLYKFLIESARLEDNTDKIIINSENLIDVDPGNLEVRLKLSSLYIKLQKYKKAKKQLDAIEVRLDTYPKVQYLKAKLYFLIDNLDKAKELANKEIDENPTIVDGYLLLADIKIKENKLVDARKLFVKAIQIDPKNVDAILGIAYVALRNDQYDMALDQYHKAIKFDPNRPDVYRLLGDSYRKLGQSQLAIKNYKHFLELSPNSQYKNSIKTYIRTMQ